MSSRSDHRGAYAGPALPGHISRRPLVHVAPRRFQGLTLLPAFSLIELIVVIVIITVLLTAVVTVGRSVVQGGQVRDTAAMLKTVRDAVDQFRADAPLQSVSQTTGGAGKVRYATRFGNYPPDELELFTAVGLRGSKPPGGSIAPGSPSPVMAPMLNASAEYPPMKFYSEGLDEDELKTEHRDLAAMLLAIRLYSDAGSAILDTIPARYWSGGAVDADGESTQFLDRAPSGFGPEDVQIRYLVDFWKMPISYMSQRDWLAKPPKGVSNHPSSNRNGGSQDWNRASTQMIALNGGAPIIMSYGPDGHEQLKKVNIEASSLLIDDWLDGRRVDHPLNDDNVYADPALGRALARGNEG